MSLPIIIIAGVAVAFFVWILISMKKDNKISDAMDQSNAAAYAAQDAADMAAWAISIYNPASPNADSVAMANAATQWFGPKNPAFDPSNRNNVNYNPTL